MHNSCCSVRAEHPGHAPWRAYCAASVSVVIDASSMQGLLSRAERKSGWQLVEAGGDQDLYGVQHLLSRAGVERQYSGIAFESFDTFGEQDGCDQGLWYQASADTGRGSLPREYHVVFNVMLSLAALLLARPIV